jgi:hypothetical protein
MADVNPSTDRKTFRHGQWQKHVRQCTALTAANVGSINNKDASNSKENNKGDVEKCRLKNFE